MQDDKKKFPPRIMCVVDSFAGMRAALSTDDKSKEIEYLSLSEHQALTAKLVEEATKQGRTQGEDYAIALLENNGGESENKEVLSRAATWLKRVLR